MKNTQAFTLIELLVVVLIIGILSAVAVPQYKLAVAKSRIAALIPLIRNAQLSIDRYYMANNQFPETWDDIDIGLSCQSVTNAQDCKLDAYKIFHLRSYYLTAEDTRVPSVLLVYFPLNDKSKDKSVGTCYALDGAHETLANQICKNLSGHATPDKRFDGKNGKNSYYLFME